MSAISIACCAFIHIHANLIMHTHKHSPRMVSIVSCTGAGAKLQERVSGQSFNFDIAKFAKAAEASKAQAGPGPDSATKASTLKKAQASVKRDWNAQVRCNYNESCE